MLRRFSTRPSGSKRRRQSRSRPSGSSGPQRKKTSVGRSLNFKNQTYFFKRHATLSDITFNTVGVGGVIDFKLNQLPNYTDFTSLFDLYRINKVVVKFVPNYTVDKGLQTSNVQYVPDFGVAIDYDSRATPTSINQIQEYDNATIVKATRQVTKVLVPKTATPVYRDGVTSAYAQGQSKLWLDCAYVDVPHYALVFYARPSGANDLYNYVVQVKFYVAFKGLH